MRSRSWFISVAAALVSLATVKSDVSSANSCTLHLKFCDKSLMYIKKNRGPKIKPCGTPAEIFPQPEDWPFKTVLCFLFDKKLRRSNNRLPDIPHLRSL